MRMRLPGVVSALRCAARGWVSRSVRNRWRLRSALANVAESAKAQNEESAMNTRRLLLGLSVLSVAALLAMSPSHSSPQVGANDISGTVSGAKGPEAGVWVIAETRDLPTKFVRIVVTDDQGRYL